MTARPLPYWRLSFYYFFYFAFIGVFSPYFTLYLQSLAMSAADIALLMSQMQLMRLVAPTFWGWLADKRGRQVDIIRLSGLCACIGFTGFFLTDNFIQLFIPMTLMAFFWSAALPLVESLTFSHLADESHRYSRIRVWGSVGFIVAVLLGGALLDHLPIGDVPAMVFVVLLGIHVDDNQEDVAYLASKIAGLRIFSDEEGKMNLDLQTINGELLLVSQFTLYAATRKGNRPSFLESARPEQAIPLYELMISTLETKLGKKIQTGVFGADMQINLTNDGPVTIIIDSKKP